MNTNTIIKIMDKFGNVRGTLETDNYQGLDKSLRKEIIKTVAAVLKPGYVFSGKVYAGELSEANVFTRALGDDECIVIDTYGEKRHWYNRHTLEEVTL